MENVKELYIDSVTFRYANSREAILSGVYLHCSPGDIIALLGRNGCGKSTLMKIIFGTLRAQHSYIRLNGKRITKAYLSCKVGYLPQHSFLPDDESVERLVRLLIDEPKVVDELLSHDRVQKMKKQKIYQLSGGERRYLELRILMSQPTDFLLLDEPFSGLEPIYKTLISELIMQHSAQKGFVISDHSYHDVLEIASHILLLQNGACRPIVDRKELEYFYVPEGTFDGK